MKWDRLKSIRPMVGLLAFVALTALSYPAFSAEPESVTIFAAASTTNAINDIGKLFAQKGKGTIVPSYASSSTLAKQIENGAPAEVFISADEPWMNYLEERKLIEPGSRFNLLGNKLVLIAPSGSSVNKVEIAPKPDLVKLLGDGKLATGDPDHVPAGKYAKAALSKLGVWNDIEGRLARARRCPWSLDTGGERRNSSGDRLCDGRGRHAQSESGRDVPCRYPPEDRIPRCIGSRKSHSRWEEFPRVSQDARSQGGF